MKAPTRLFKRSLLTLTLSLVSAAGVLVSTAHLQAQGHGGGHGFGGGHSFGGHGFGGHYGGHGFYGGRGYWGLGLGLGLAASYPWWGYGGWYDPFYYPLPAYSTYPAYSYTYAAPAAAPSPVAPDPPPQPPAAFSQTYAVQPATTAMASANALFGR